MMKSDRRRGRGFTLVEILIALAIFAIVATTLVRNSMQTVKQSRQIQDRTVAQWVASNEMQRLRLVERGSLLPTGTERTNLRYALRDWQVVTVVEGTENELVRRISVEVYDDLDPDRALTELTGFVGRY